MNALIIHNPSTGTRTHDSALKDVRDELRSAGWDIRWSETRDRGDATRLARAAAADSLDAVFVVGGDGTLNEALNGLLGSQTALGVVPLGTANVWAREMGLPLDDFARAARLQADSPTRMVDVGIAQGLAKHAGFSPRAFILSCGVGFDAMVTAEVEKQRGLKKRFGRLLYLSIGARAALTYRGRRVQVTVDGKKLRRRILLGVASNTALYGGMARLWPETPVDDGLLDVVLLKGEGLLHAASHAFHIFAGLHRYTPDIEHWRAREIEIRGSRLPVHLDAEPVGTTPVRIVIRPRALRVIVPDTANRALFVNSIQTSELAPAA